MNLLLVAATPFEVSPVVQHFSLKEGDNPLSSVNNVYLLITGVGMVATAFSLGKLLSNHRFDMAINAGIAGSFNRDLAIGEVVVTEEDCFAELGAEDDEAFLSIEELGLGFNKMRPIPGALPLTDCKTVKGITVNRVHGNEQSIGKSLLQWQADVESMEGAAFFYACKQVNLPSIQLRAISNYVEKRNRGSWDITTAIGNLNKALTRILSAYI